MRVDPVIQWRGFLGLIGLSKVMTRCVIVWTAAFAGATVGLPGRSYAQEPARDFRALPVRADSTLRIDRHWLFGAWFAGGTHEPIKTREGHMEDRALYVLGVSASRTVAHWRLGELRLTPTLVPAIIATANREYQSVVYDGGTVGVLPYKKTAFGVGLIPFAAEMRFRFSDRTGIVLGGGGGAAYFDRRIPDPDETRFNFLADGHTGLYIRSGLGTATFGFRLQHISNGDTGRVNPGLDSRMLFVGFGR